MEINCALFPRRDIDLVGVAPLTSMYWFGPEDRAGVDDFRDAVHDSDGLAHHQRLWRAHLAAAAQSAGSGRDLVLRRREPGAASG